MWGKVGKEKKKKKMGGGALEDWMKSNALIDYTWAHIGASCKNIYNLLPPPFQKIKWRRKEV